MEDIFWALQIFYEEYIEENILFFICMTAAVSALFFVGKRLIQIIYMRGHIASGLTAEDAAVVLLYESLGRRCDSYWVNINRRTYYSARDMTVYLAENIWHNDSISAAAIAAHEAVHAIDSSRKPGLLRAKEVIYLILRIVQELSLAVLLFGFLMDDSTVIGVGFLLFVLYVLFCLVTLPYELHTSRRAQEMLWNLGFLTEKERKQFGRVLLTMSFSCFDALVAFLLDIPLLLLEIIRSRIGGVWSYSVDDGWRGRQRKNGSIRESQRAYEKRRRERARNGGKQNRHLQDRCDYWTYNDYLTSVKREKKG